MQTTGKKSKPRSSKALTDAERHRRFLEMAKEVGAADDQKALEAAFKKVVARPPEPRKKPK
jgi:hypothetical protein